MNSSSGGVGAADGVNVQQRQPLRRRMIENAHIFGIVLAYELFQCAGASLTVVAHSLWQIADYYFDFTAILNEQLLQLPLWFVRLWNMMKTYAVFTSYIRLGALLLTVLVLAWLLNRESKRLKALTPVQEGSCVKVKKTPYIWLGFLLGGYGAHLFLFPAADRRKAWIFLIMGICGAWLHLLMWYTIGISLADAWLACRMEADDEGYITVEKYDRIL